MSDTTNIDINVNPNFDQELQAFELNLPPDPPSKLSTFIERWLSKKLFALILATVLLCVGKIDGNIWETIAIAWLGAQGIVDGVRNYVGGPRA